MIDFKALLEKAEKERMKKHDLILYKMLVKSTGDFLSENFDGAFAVEISDVGYNTADISIDGYAGFIRRLFDMIFGRTLIKVHIFEENETLFVNFSWKNADISDADMKELAYLATSSGFSLDFKVQDEANCISARIEKAKLYVYQIYATDDDRLTPRLFFVFRDFFGRHKN